MHSIVGGRLLAPRNQHSSEMILPGTYVPWVGPPSHPELFGIFRHWRWSICGFFIPLDKPEHHTLHPTVLVHAECVFLMHSGRLTALPWKGGAHPPHLHLPGESASRNFLIAWSDSSDLAFVMMKEALVSCRAILWQFLADAMNGDEVAYHFLHRPHCTRDKNMSAALSPIKPLLPESHYFFPWRSQKKFRIHALDFTSGPTHSSVVPSVDPK